MPIARALTVLILGVCAISLPATVVAQECPDGRWPTTTFEVRDYRAIPFLDWTNAARRTPEVWAARLEAFVEELPFQEPSAVETAQTRLLERELQNIAMRLEAGGFGCPRMETVERDGTLRYVAYLINFSGDPERGYKKVEPGAEEDYARRQRPHGVAYPTIDVPHFVINRESVVLPEVVAPGAGADGSDTTLDYVHLYRILAHELFHLVQGTYDRRFRSISWSTKEMGRDFVVEGSADGVARFLASQRYPGSEARETSQQLLGGYAYFDTVLHAQNDNDFLNAYATSSFWLHLMERYGGLGVIERLLRHPIGKVTEGRLDWLDTGLRVNPSVGKSLGAVFPQFVAEMASYGYSRYDAVMPDEWLRWTLAGCIDPAFDSKGTDPSRARQLNPFTNETRRSWWADPLESICINVNWEAFPDRLRPTLLQVEVSALDATSLDQAQVGLAAQGTDYCWPTTKSCMLDGDVTFQVAGRHHRTFNVSLEKSTGSMALLTFTNVAPRAAAATKSTEDVDIHVRLLWEETTMTPRGPSAADIDAPHPIELDRITAGVFQRPSTVAKSPNECTLTLRGSNKQTGDGIEFALVQSGPIGPGVYQISAADRPQFLEAADVPGTFTGGFHFGRGNPLGGGRPIGFWFLSGEVEITSVSGGLVRGEVRANGWRSRHAEPGAPYVREGYGPDRYSATARFAFIPNKMLPAKAAAQMARACLATDPPSTTPPPLPGQPPPLNRTTPPDPPPSGQPPPSDPPPSDPPPPVQRPPAGTRPAPPAGTPPTAPPAATAAPASPPAQADPPAAPPPAAGSTAGPPAFSIAGTWSTRYGEMHLKQSGAAVAGTYEGGSSFVAGALVKRLLEGVWYKPRSARACATEREGTRFWGRIRFTFVSDTRFEGVWGYCEEEPTQSWTGTRAQVERGGM